MATAASSFALVLPPKFGYVALTGAASVLLTQWQGFKVGMQRKKCGLKYPKMYEDKEDSLFDCYQRAHQNTLEGYPAFLSLLLLGGLGYPVVSSIFGMIWVTGRVFYSLGYYSGDPKKRLQGAWYVVGLLGLLVTTSVFGVRLVLAA